LGSSLSDPLCKVAGVQLRGNGVGGLQGVGARQRTDPPSRSMVGRLGEVVVRDFVAGLPLRDVRLRAI
jgi:hypothetical protein